MALTEEGRKKISELHKGREPWNKGKNISEEQKKKISKALIDRGGSWNKGLKKGQILEALSAKASIAPLKGPIVMIDGIPHTAPTGGTKKVKSRKRHRSRAWFEDRERKAREILGEENWEKLFGSDGE